MLERTPNFRLDFKALKTMKGSLIHDNLREEIPVSVLAEHCQSRMAQHEVLLQHPVVEM